MTNEVEQKIKILLAEDDKFLATALGDKLTREGFEVVKVASGQAVVEAIKESHPRLVLLDIIMPQKTGFEVLSEMRLAPALKNIPVIVLSNLGQEADIEKAKSLGARAYLVKSDVDLKTVLETIKNELAKVG